MTDDAMHTRAYRVGRSQPNNIYRIHGDLWTADDYLGAMRSPSLGYCAVAALNGVTGLDFDQFTAVLSDPYRVYTVELATVVCKNGVAIGFAFDPTFARFLADALLICGAPGPPQVAARALRGIA